MRHAGGGPESWGRRKLSKTASLGACSIASTRSLPAFRAFCRSIGSGCGPEPCERFGVDRMVDDYLAVYERLVSRDHHTRAALA